MARGAASDPMIGVEFGGYRIERRLGRGGMGVVYLAESLHLGRKVALKVLPPEVSDDERYRSRFLRESRLAASLDHPNVVPIYDAGEHDGRLYLAMRYVDGTDLAVLLRDGPLTFDETISILAGMASALDVAHARGLVHRDVKPANILLAGPSRHPYLADFGLTKLASSGPSAATIGEMVGTPDYVAPEQIRGEPISGAADVYSLGCVAYECLTGEPPFRGTGDLASVWAHLQKDVPPPSERRPDLPLAVDAVVERALAKDPADRFPTCAAFVEALADALGIPQVPVQRATSRPARRAWVRSRGAAIIGVGLAAVLAIGAVALRPWEPRGTGIEVDAIAFLDAGSGALLHTLHVPGTTTDHAVVADGFFWLRGRDPDVLYQIDPDTHTLTRTIPWGMPSPNWWAVDGGSIWATDATAPRIVRIDVLTGARSKVIDVLAKDAEAPPIEALGGIAVGAGSVWVAGDRASDSVVQRYDPITGQLQAEIGVPYADLVYFGAGSAWVLARPGQLYRIDPASNTIGEPVLVPGSEATYVAFANGYAWTADPGTGTVWKIDPTATIAASYVTGFGALSLSATDAGVWVADSRAGTLSRIDATTGRIDRLAVGHYPAAVAVLGSTLMVPVEASAADQIAELQGSVLRVGMRGDPVSPPDPAVNSAFDYRTIAYATCARLLTYRDADAPDGWTLFPEVAAAMPELSADRRTYTFTIRSGYAFSPPSNAPVTAEAVRASLERALSPEIEFARATYYLSDVVGAAEFHEGTAERVSGLEVTGDDRLTIRLTEPASDFLHRLAAHNLCLVPPETPAAADGVDPVPMAGPYYVLRHDDKVAILARNPGYPGPRPAKYDYIALELYRSVGESIQQVDAGDLDVVPIPPGGEFSDLARVWGPDSPNARAGDQRWHGVPSQALVFLSLNRTAGSMRDPTIRKAFQLAIDRPAASAVWFEPPIGRLIPPGVPSSGVDVVPLDDSGLSAARDLMRGRHVTVRYAYLDLCERCPMFATAITPRLAAVGITLEAHPVRGDLCNEVFCDPNLASQYDVVLGNIQARYADPYAFLSLLPEAMPEGWVTEEERAAIDEIRSLDGEERVAAAAQFAERFVRDEAALVPISYPEGSAYVGPGVECRVMQPTLTAIDLAVLCP
jgi:ABC-type transport system substrate-binding protein/sugar lactone lactonase YvrE